MRQFSYVEIEKAIQEWVHSEIKEDGRVGDLLIKPTILTRESCLFLSDQTDLLIASTRVKTEFEVMPHLRNLWRDLLEKYQGNVVLIAMGMPYRLTVPHKTTGYGFIDGVAAFDDYHLVMRGYFEGLSQSLLDIPVFTKEYEIHIDTSPYIDRDIGYWGGLGAYGRHHQLMNSKMGAHFNLGFLILETIDKGFQPRDVKAALDRLNQLSQSSKLFDGCQSCDACARACPMKICGDMDMERVKCISYLTQTKKKIPEEFLIKMGSRLYGCSHCQYACPFGKVDQVHSGGDLPLVAILELTQRQFKAKYTHTGFAWRGLSILKRNAVIALNNQGIKISEALYDKLKHNEVIASYVQNDKEA